MMNITYRIASIQDLDEVNMLVKQAIENMKKYNLYHWDETYPTREDLNRDIMKQQLYVGVTDDEIAVIYVLNREDGDDYETGAWQYKDAFYYVVHRLCVKPAFQQKGIARITMSHIEEQVKELGGAAIRLDVFSKNPYGIRLYLGCGYKQTGQVLWEKGIFYLMEKGL